MPWRARLSRALPCRKTVRTEFVRWIPPHARRVWLAAIEDVWTVYAPRQHGWAREWAANSGRRVASGPGPPVVQLQRTHERELSAGRRQLSLARPVHSDQRLARLGLPRGLHTVAAGVSGPAGVEAPQHVHVS
eukprot:scaffold108939_cov60-Phaeocystis_antarctica.AAC.3